VIFALVVFSVIAMLVRVCILCSFVWSPDHGLLSGSLNEGVSSISLVVRVLIVDDLMFSKREEKKH
jgi:hypothetical protein